MKFHQPLPQFVQLCCVLSWCSLLLPNELETPWCVGVVEADPGSAEVRPGGGLMESSLRRPVPALWTKRRPWGSHGQCWFPDTHHKLLLSLSSSRDRFFRKRYGGEAFQTAASQSGPRDNPEFGNIQSRFYLTTINESHDHYCPVINHNNKCHSFPKVPTSPYVMVQKDACLIQH